jgi:hypothetical protein
MNRNGWIAFGILVLIIAAIVAFFLLLPKASAPATTATSTPETGNLEGQSLYANGTYGFTLKYPAHATEHDEFSTSYILSQQWRAEAPLDSTGTPVVEIVGYHTESDHSYPREYTAMVRVGVSTSTADIASCTKTTADTGETALADAVINGTTWKAFSFGDAATMHFVQGVSYRTVHDGKCYVMEKLATGSSYKDDPASADDVPQATLDAAYNDLDPIIQSFSFTQ